MILTKIAKKRKECDFLYFAENTEVYLFCPEEGLKKSNGKIFNKGYLLRFIDRARFMNTYLDSLVNNLLENIYNKV